MKNKLLITLLSITLAANSLMNVRSAQAGIVGVAIFGSGAIKADPDAVGLKRDLWLLTAASAGVIYGGIKLLGVGKSGLGKTLGIIGGVVVILLDESENVRGTHLEETLVLAYPEIDNREWISELAELASIHSKLVPATHPDAMAGSQLIDVKIPEAELDALLMETSLTDEVIARLKSDLL